MRYGRNDGNIRLKWWTVSLLIINCRVWANMWPSKITFIAIDDVKKMCSFADCKYTSKNSPEVISTFSCYSQVVWRNANWNGFSKNNSLEHCTKSNNRKTQKISNDDYKWHDTDHHL